VRKLRVTRTQFSKDMILVETVCNTKSYLEMLEEMVVTERVGVANARKSYSGGVRFEYWPQLRLS
jgi:hypothetical protein